MAVSQSAPQAATESLAESSAADARDAIARGAFSSVDLVKACLGRIAAREDDVRAWQHLDPDFALEQAEKADAWRKAGRSLGPLHGVPVGIKDIIDTKEMPTQHGSPYFAGRQPHQDATVVAALKDAGAIVLGKTVTTEVAFFYPGKTCNPRNPQHTPGGSSSGSAAAVADYMVPLALGTQTAGSVIRPAAYCGVVGFKPTFGLISRHGILPQSPPLDTVGVFGRTVDDVALAADCMTASDPNDRDMWPRSRPRLFETARSEPPAKPVLAYVKSPVWNQAEPVLAEAFEELVSVLGDRVEEVSLPGDYADGYVRQQMLQSADIARQFGPLVDRDPDQFSDALKAMIEKGRKVPAVDYNIARDHQVVLNAGLERLMHRYSAILTPASTGPAPKGLDSTGSPVFNALWTYAGVPAVTLPLLESEGLPIGVQLVGSQRNDGRLLRTARWLAHYVAETE